MNMFESFNKEINLSTKLNVFVTLLILFFSYLLDVNEWRIVVTSLLILFSILALDYYMIISTLYPATWRITKWVLLFSLLIISLIAFIAKITLVY